MFLEGDFLAQSCANEFAFNFGIIMAAGWQLTAMVVVVVGVWAAARRPSAGFSRNPHCGRP